MKEWDKWREGGWGGKADVAGEWRSRGQRREDGNAESESVRRVGGREQEWWGWGQGLQAWERCEVVSEPPKLPPGSSAKDTVVKRWVARGLAAEACPGQ